MEQRTPEWYAARCGKVTASRIVDIVTRLKGGGYSAARAKYMESIIAERMTGRPQDMRRLPSLDARADMEPDARVAYTFYTGREVEIVGFIQHPSIELSGSSPDGLVETDGMMEIKALDPATHIRLLSGDVSVMIDYLPQMQFGMACAERQWCDFESFAPAMQDEALRVFIRRVDRDDEVIGMIEREVEMFLSEVDARLAPLLALTA